MIRSMTAFASRERSTAWGTLAAELRSVNHRFLEVGLRLPEEARVLEPLLRERIAARIGRGKLDFSLRLRAPEAGAGLAVDAPLLERLGILAEELRGRFPALQVGFTDLLQFPGVVRSASVDPAELQAELLALMDELLDDFVAAREREGLKLAEAIAERNEAIARLAEEARALMPAIREGQRLKLQARLLELMQPGGESRFESLRFEPGRMEQELALWLQKLDVDEELDRLGSHVQELRRVLRQREPVGRRLDFLLQEFNREANTLGSKSVDVRTSNLAVELKVLIDQIPEQASNIE